MQRTQLLVSMILVCERQLSIGRVGRGRVGWERRDCILHGGIGIKVLVAVLDGGFNGVDLCGRKSSPGVRGALCKGATA